MGGKRKIMKKFLSEFKAFALKGNVMDLAIGVIIGAAFQDIVKALTADFITPLIAALTGSVGEDGKVTIGGQFTINGASFNYGDFISSIINFLIMAFILFLLVRVVNKMMNLGKKEPAKTVRDCPYCLSKISVKACKCPNCTSDVEPLPEEEEDNSTRFDRIKGGMKAKVSKNKKNADKDSEE